MAVETPKRVDIEKQRVNYESRFPLEMGILRLGAVYPGYIRTGEESKNPYTDQPDLDADGHVEYYGNVGEHCIAVATFADIVATKIFGTKDARRNPIAKRALVHDATKGYEIMRRKAVKAGVIDDAYSPKAYEKLKPHLIAKGVTGEIAEYMTNAGSETGHNSMKDFVVLDPQGQRKLKVDPEDGNLAAMIVHIADDMTYTPIVKQDEQAQTTYETTADRMQASDFPNRYKFLYKEGFGFDETGQPVMVKDTNEAPDGLREVHTYAEWQVWVADQIALHLGQRMPEQEGGTQVDMTPAQASVHLRDIVNASL